ncbi:unnamed protein product [Notodromas monacha]|uniref:Cysteine-rich DPF motif domain-containing protein 1 n=1 Tax=Notodromas monacha TaxID=399045 RepID=A0A7R9BIF8_9CRUS|nr:unnamed protein product [Notodromas monacha]CAG0916099.1 unnamed protein product [Notodromas monacha]
MDDGSEYSKRLSARIEEDAKKIFHCSQCEFTEPFHYKGRNPPFKRTVWLKEDSYVNKDPFVPRGEGLFVVLGSDCSVCDQQVCQNPGCSVFYERRICLPCFKANKRDFPEKLVAKVASKE